MNLARAREKCRDLAGRARHEAGQAEIGPMNEAVRALAEAVELLADISESQDLELRELSKRIGAL